MNFLSICDFLFSAETPSDEFPLNLRFSVFSGASIGRTSSQFAIFYFQRGFRMQKHSLNYCLDFMGYRVPLKFFRVPLVNPLYFICLSLLWDKGYVGLDKNCYRESESCKK